ncbi:MAG: DUF4097 family beta strand repeat-containing protein [Clostridia bacterium]
MTTLQKVIKYCAVAFALLLIVSIIGGAVQAVASLSRCFDEDEDVLGEMKTTVISEDVRDLEIDLGGAELEIRTGDELAVKSNHKYLETENQNGLLRITESRSVFGLDADGVRVILTVPKNFTFERVRISAGAGVMNIDTLLGENVTMELGAGEVSVGCLVASDRAKIDGGAGELTILGGSINDLDMDLGIGEVILKSRLTGNSCIDCGAGELELTLSGSAEDYRITPDKGVGEALLDGKKMLDGETYGSGENCVELNGGVGSMLVRFDESQIITKETKDRF